MKKLLVSLMALSIVSIGAASYAGPLGDALNDAAKTVNQREQKLENAHNEAVKREQARQKAREQQRQEWVKKQEQARKDAEARQKAREKELQKKKDAWNTLMGK